MNSGGEPERDDTGLPPVDIEIPDDARELDRDVQAYYREQRAERRRRRHRRLHGVLTRDGILLPLLACCLILALITGTLLTVFTATSDQNLTQLPGYGTGTGTGTNPHVVPTRQPLPEGTLKLGNGPLRLQNLGRTLLVLVPPACNCRAGVSWLANIAASQGALIYLVSTRTTQGEANLLAASLQLPVAFDSHGLLQKFPVKGLTAVMVAGYSPPADAAYAQHLRANDSPAPLIHALNG